MSRRLFPFFLALMMFCPLTGAQDTSAQREQKEKLEKEIELINRQLSSTDSKSRSALSNYNLLSKKISNRKKLLEASRRKEREIADQIYLKQKEINSLQASCDTLAAHYDRLVLSAYKNRDSRIWYMYILASDDLSQAYRRYGYFKSLASQIQTQAAIIEEQKAELLRQKAALQEMKTLQKRQSEESGRELGRLTGEQKDASKLVDRLKKEKKRYQKELAAKKKQVEALDREITRIVREAMKKSPSGKTEIDRALATEFSKNKGLLPWPADGPVVEPFGERYHQVYKNIKLPKNNGIDIALKSGTAVCCVFDGVVKQVLVMPGYNQCVLVQHGNYFTFYCKLRNVKVKSGQKVTTGQQLGVVDTINKETQLHFQVWKDTTPQNPESWLK